MRRRARYAIDLALLLGMAGLLVAPCGLATAQALDSAGMPSLELLAAEAGRASRRHPIRLVARAFLCEPGHPLVDSASLVACAALDSVRSAAITTAFARGLEVPLAEAAGGDAAIEAPICPADLDRVVGPRVLVARLVAPVVGVHEGQWEGRLMVEVRCRSPGAAGAERIRTMGKEYLYQWTGNAWRMYQHAWLRSEQ